MEQLSTRGFLDCTILRMGDHWFTQAWFFRSISLEIPMKIRQLILKMKPWSTQITQNRLSVPQGLDWMRLSGTHSLFVSDLCCLIWFLSVIKQSISYNRSPIILISEWLICIKIHWEIHSINLNRSNHLICDSLDYY